MCLSVPGQVVEILEDAPLARRARVDFGGTLRETNLALAPEAGVGDWVLVHAGIAIGCIDAEQAERALAQFREIRALEDGPPEPAP
ncbi:MAG: HypC/HybG/HupF family hydrogenase formation chaperone [Burkholderiales bacterium]|nr:HypC/HybG/HupF family hydrogenase formation chaperone [Burkholderiales bacterium]